MKRRLFAYLSIILLVIGVGGVLVSIALMGMRTDQKTVHRIMTGVNELSEIFYISAKAQSALVEHRLGQNTDTDNLMEEIETLDRLLGNSLDMIHVPEISRRCIACHEQMGNESWKAMEPRLLSIRKLVDQYEMQVRAVIASEDPDARMKYEAEAFRTSQAIVKLSSHLKDTSDVIIGELIDQNSRSIEWILAGILLTVLFTVIASYLAVILLVKKIVYPLDTLFQASTTLAAGTYPERITLETDDEFQQVVDAFNEMVEKRRQINQELETKVQEATSELRKTQEQLVRSQTLQAVGTLAAGVSHEISNPLGIILGIASLAQKHAEPGTTIYEDLKTIEDETARCQKIIEGLLDFARFRDIALRPVDINAVLNDCLDLVSYQKPFKKVEIVRNFQEGLPATQADANRLKQVFVNLSLNAAQAINGEGKLEVRTRLIDDDGRPTIRVCFDDTGRGIPSHLLERIFDPFFTTKKGSKGSGLGLSISNRIIEQHGGVIAVKSAEGEGASFCVQLPVRTEIESEVPDEY